MMLVVILSLLIGLSVASPPTPKICGRRNPKLEECAIASMMEMMPSLRKGIPEWNVPQLEPMYMKEMIISNDNTIKAKATEVYMRGLSYFNITYLKIDLKNNKISLSVIFPKAELDAQVDLSARLLVPIVGKGSMHTTNEGITANAVLKFKVVEREGKTYIYFYETTLKLGIETVKSDFKLSNDPGGVLGNAINSAVQTSDRGIVDQILEILQQKLSEMIMKLANNVCKHFPMDELLPDRE